MERRPIPAGNPGFPRTARLLRPAEFKQVFRDPVVSADGYFKVLARYNEERYSRLGMAVSRQVDKRATVRNRIKRVIRESFRQQAAAWAASANAETDSRQSGALDVVVLPRRSCADLSNDALFRSLDGHWSRLEQRLREKTT